MGFADLLKFWRRRTPLIWHARRNNEMIAGVLLRALGWPLKLVFTSAAQRHHTWITRWLIRQMDAIIATTEISASFLKREATVVMHGVDTDRLRAAGRSRGGVCGSRIAGPLRDRLLRPGARAKGQRCVRRRRCAGCCRAIPISPRSWSARSRRSSSGFANDLKKRIEAAGLQSRIVITGELADRGGAALVPAADDLRLHLAQRRFWTDADRGDVGGRGAGGVARGRGRTRGRGWRDRRADAAGRCRCAGGGAGAADARSGFGDGDGRAGARAGAGEIQPRCGGDRIAEVYRTLV